MAFKEIFNLIESSGLKAQEIAKQIKRPVRDYTLGTEGKKKK